MERCRFSALHSEGGLNTGCEADPPQARSKGAGSHPAPGESPAPGPQAGADAVPRAGDRGVPGLRFPVCKTGLTTATAWGGREPAPLCRADPVGDRDRDGGGWFVNSGVLVSILKGEASLCTTDTSTAGCGDTVSPRCPGSMGPTAKTRPAAPTPSPAPPGQQGRLRVRVTAQSPGDKGSGCAWPGSPVPWPRCGQEGRWGRALCRGQSPTGFL